ncbi:siderophore-interacting protein [Chondromyces apiculatus]|uniref:Iron-chelator utilization protein n=1 Tax=Chondromyces apiculatus DSM 436 TaxID=1192034 RepID=A0A017T5K9_9BACT|nr:siderophore-interacting protein [Chondromyces apiculatus]EYF03866.1 iron-chelator utilization protein [Chondromyces apiculatus DSM 436]
MSQSERVFRRGPFPVKFRILEVRRVTQITPHMARVTLGGADLEGFHSDAPDDHVKVAIPAEGEVEVPVPTLGPGGLTFPEGKPRPVLRDYTPRRHDPAAGELDIDFVIHGDGPATRWAASAKPGHRLGVGGPRGSLIVAADFDWYLLVGDESALPAIGRRLEELPAGARAQVFVEVADAAEEQRFETKAEVQLTYLHRNGAEAGATDLLEAAVRGASFPGGDGFAWVAGESGTVRRIRDYLREERGLSKDWMRTSGYWKRGVAGHHD